MSRSLAVSDVRDTGIGGLSANSSRHFIKIKRVPEWRDRPGNAVVGCALGSLPNKVD